MLRPLFAVLLALALPLPADAARGPSTAEERKRAVKITRELEQQPLARRAMDARKWLYQWIVEIPDIHVVSCSGPLDVLLVDEDDAYGQILYVQSVFGMASFLVENPKKSKDWVAVQTAGIESTLRAYEALRKTDSEARWKALDRLVAARNGGKLRALVKEQMAECAKPASERMGPAPADAI